MKDKRGSVKIALIQQSCTVDIKQNVEQSISKINETAKQGAKIICLSELFNSLYFCQSEQQRFFDLAEPLHGPTLTQMSKVAAQNKVYLIVPFFEKRTEGLYHNSAVVYNPKGECIAHYRKMHIPDDPLFMEKYYFAPGDKGFFSIDTEYAKIGVLICWDQWYPEAARLTALSGAEIIFYPTAIGWVPEDDKETQAIQHEAWETMQRSHAIANGVFVAAANRVGREAEINFWGSSFVANPMGKVLKRAYANQEDLLLTDCNLDEIRNTREQWPFLRDRRIDAYGGLLKRFID